MFHDDDMALMGDENVGERSSGEIREGNPAHMPSSGEKQPRKKARRGFAAMSPEKQKEIASLGGKAAHAKGTAHEFSPEEAREAGRKGGQAAQRARNQTKH